MKNIAILGSTGSVGTSTLNVVEAHPEHFQVVALAAGRNLDVLRPQIKAHQPEVVGVARSEDARTLAREFSATRFVSGGEGLEEVACCEEAEMVVAALVGSVGLAPTLAAVRAGKDVALANKETLVVAGSLVMDEVRRAGVELLPVDSEHNAIHQALRVGPEGSAIRLVLTASGGPFRSWSAEEMARATIDDALDHPTWRMGPKISIDSATMMNKGLEIIEAHHLFGFPEERIDVAVHPQSLIHSLVEYVDGTTIAQLSVNDMRHPILYALSWPDRQANRLPRLDLVNAPALTFEAPDEVRFPALGLARSALRAGGEMPAVLNAANEVAVAAFLEGRCALPAVAATVADTLEGWNMNNRPLEDLEQALAADREAREIARTKIRKYLVNGAGSEIRC
jgi:1-deoxy-D-xylulose-5-phosphate reductoisomerase